MTIFLSVLLLFLICAAQIKAQEHKIAYWYDAINSEQKQA